MYISHRGKWNIHSPDNSIAQICETLRRCHEFFYTDIIIEIDIQIHRDDPSRRLWLHHDDLPTEWKDFSTTNHERCFDLLTHPLFQAPHTLMLDLKYHPDYSPSPFDYLKCIANCISQANYQTPTLYLHSFCPLLFETWYTHKMNLLHPQFVWGSILEKQTTSPSPCMQVLWNPYYLLIPKLEGLPTTFMPYERMGLYTLGPEDEIDTDDPSNVWYVVDDLEQRLLRRQSCRVLLT